MYYVFLENFSDELYKILSSHYAAVITTSSQRIIKQRETKQEEDEIDIIVAAYISQVTANKVTEISMTTRKHIKQTIKKGIAEGLSIPEISKLIRRNRSFAPYRATMIARTETHSAMNYADFEMSKN